MSFAEAVRSYVTELRAEMRHHPSFEELEAYGHGLLSDGRRDELAEHLALCGGCGVLLQYGVLDASGPGRAAHGITAPDRADLDRQWEALSHRLDRASRHWRPLSSSLPEGRPPLKVVLSVGRAVAEALAVLHAAGEVVRDLRIEALLVDAEQRRIKLLDLGIAAIPESLEAGNGRSAQELMADAVRAASPEQVAGERLDYRSNLFSLGSLVYEMATGVAPFRGQTPLETASRVLALEALPAVQLRDDLPPALDTLLQRLLNKDPNKRPSSAAAVAAALEAIENGVANPLKALETDDLDAEIETLYRRIDTLTQASRSGGDAETESEIAKALAQLRKLQKAEAARFRKEFEARLAMPVDAGAKILSRARSLRKRLESLTARNPASR